MKKIHVHAELIYLAPLLHQRSTIAAIGLLSWLHCTCAVS